MKKILTIFVSALILGLVNNASAQMYVNAGGGYHLPAATETGWLSNYTNTGTNVHREAIKLSLGKGIQAGATFGYMLNENVGAELGVGYLMGSEFTDKYTSDQGSGSSFISEETMKGTMLRLMPALVITTGEGSAKPYARMGAVIGMMPNIMLTSKSTSSDASGSTVTMESWEFTGGTPMGFTGALGAKFGLSDKLSLFGEVSFISQSWAMKKATMTEYTVDGVDQMSQLTTSDKEIVFEDSYTESTTSSNDNEPSKMYSYTMPFSSWGINLGISFTLGGE